MGLRDGRRWGGHAVGGGACGDDAGARDELESLHDALALDLALALRLDAGQPPLPIDVLFLIQARAVGGGGGRSSSGRSGLREGGGAEDVSLGVLAHARGGVDGVAVKTVEGPAQRG